MDSLHSQNITPSDWHVMGYGAISGFGFGFWDNHEVVPAIIFSFIGFQLMVATVVFAKAADSFGLIRLPWFGVIRMPFIGKYKLWTLIIITPVCCLVLQLINRKWYNAMVLIWLLLPLGYLFWQSLRRSEWNH